MCITFFYIAPNNSSHIKFFVAFNREENTSRPTLPLNYFKEDPNIIGGRDLKQKGTWLGFNKKTMNVAFLTNYFIPLFRRDSKINYKSRGDIVYDFLKSDFYEKNIEKSEIIAYLQKIKHEKGLFPPFNLVLGNIKLMKFYFFGNYHQFNDFLIIGNGLYNMCNFEMFFESMNEREKFGIEYLEGLMLKEENKEKNTLIDQILNLMKGNNNETKNKVFQNISFLTTLTTSILIIDNDYNSIFREITYVYKFPLLARYFALMPNDIKIKEIKTQHDKNFPFA